jgi:hypothetical protein
MNNSIQTDKFGMLFKKINVNVPNSFRIRPVSNYDEIFEWCKQYIENRYIYPPVTQSITINALTNEETARGPERGATIYKMPSTHEIEYLSDDTQDNHRRNTGAFILGALSVLFNCRLQWENWWHEDKIPAELNEVAHIKNGEVIKLFDQEIVLPDQLSEAFIIMHSKWNSLTIESQRVLLNALFFHQKAISYNWGYERFFSDYTAIEAIWKCGEIENLWPKKIRARNKNREFIEKNPGHGDRLLIMIHYLEMYHKASWFQGSEYLFRYCYRMKKEIKSIYTCRNELYHEGIWGDRNRLDLQFNNRAADKIHCLVKRLILSYLGIRNSLTRSPWWWLSSNAWTYPDD